MAEASGKKSLTLNLSHFNNSSESKPPSPSFDSAKSPRNFEAGVVGLGIVAAMNESGDGFDAVISAKPSRTAVLAVYPRSLPIPISTTPSGKSAAKYAGEPISEKNKMVLSESYTCVISISGNDLIKKREYYDDEISGSAGYVVNPGVFSADVPYHHQKTADFLHSCYLCKRTLQGLDIFMYRGEKAFCSAECRDKQMSSDEHKEKCKSKARKPLDCSESPCSSPLQFFTGVVAA